MGVESSRVASLPESIDQMYDECVRTWMSEEQKMDKLNQCVENKSTLGSQTIEKAGKFAGEYFNSLPSHSVNILDIFSGNGVASKIFMDSFMNHCGKIDTTIICTDLNDFSLQVNTNACAVHYSTNSVDAIDLYGPNANILMMISPPPTKANHYADYFAIHKWTKLSNSQYIIFVGELGASDGSEGLYKYLLEHPKWKLVLRQMLDLGIDMFGGNVEKELFVFGK
jgi:hypothetical protein